MNLQQLEEILKGVRRNPLKSLVLIIASVAIIWIIAFISEIARHSASTIGEESIQKSAIIREDSSTSEFENKVSIKKNSEMDDNRSSEIMQSSQNLKGNSFNDTIFSTTSTNQVSASDFGKIIGKWEKNGLILQVDNVDGKLQIKASSMRGSHVYSISQISWDGQSLEFILHNLTIDHQVLYNLSVNERGYLGGTFQELKPAGMVAFSGGTAFRRNK